MSDYYILKTPVSLFPGGYNSTLSIKNNDTVNTVYLGESTTKCQQGQGLPLGPLSSVSWDAGRPLWAVAPAVGAGNLVMSVVDNSGAIFSASDIAEQILAAGLATDIANAIVASGLTSQNIANDIFVTGTPPVDKYTLLDDSGIFSGGAGYASPAVDTSGYQSIALTFSNGFPTTALPGEVSITWYAAQAANVTDIIGYDDFIVGTGPLSQVIFPVRGPWYKVVVTAPTGGGHLKSFGSYKAAVNSYCNLLGTGSANGVVVGGGSQGIQNWNSVAGGNVPLNATWIWQPDVIGGRAQLAFRIVPSTSGGNITIFLRCPTNIYPLVLYNSTDALAISNTQTIIYNLVLPPIPLEVVFVNNNSTGATYAIRATLTNERQYS